ncbi:MAG: PilZ domain-containing protein [Burkholderiaceae bacterium]|nr:MAG: PilZ domain-containing protein [Burkholderiaceae bacterium]
MSSTGSGSDARKTIRVAVVWRGGVILGPGNYLLTKVIDISEGGLAFLCQQNFPVNTTLTLGIEIPAPDSSGKRHQCVCSARVTHTILSHGDYKVGVNFVDIQDEYRTLIKTWVNKQLSPGI